MASISVSISDNTNPYFIELPDNNSWGLWSDTQGIIGGYAGSLYFGIVNGNPYYVDSFKIKPEVHPLSIPNSAKLYYSHATGCYRHGSGFFKMFTQGREYEPIFAPKTWVYINGYYYLLYTEVEQEDFFKRNVELYDIEIEDYETQAIVSGPQPYQKVRVIPYVKYDSNRIVFTSNGGEITTNNIDTNDRIVINHEFNLNPQLGTYMVWETPIIETFQGTDGLQFSITVVPWKNELYRIVKKIPRQTNVYVGKTISDDVLSKHRLNLNYSNDFGSNNIIIQSSLNRSDMVKTKWIHTDSMANSDYKYNGVVVTQFRHDLIYLASGNDKFKFLTNVKTKCKRGDIINLISLANDLGGALKYSDESTISLSEFTHTKTVICSLGSGNTHYIGDTTQPFTITYNISSTEFGALIYVVNVNIESGDAPTITKATAYNLKSKFKYDEIVDYGEASYIELEDSQGIRTTVYPHEFNAIITNSPPHLGKRVGNNLNMHPLNYANSFRVLGINVAWNFVVEYSQLSINAFSMQTNYFVGGTHGNEVELDLTNFVGNEVRYNRISNSSIETIDVVGQCEFEILGSYPQTGSKQMTVQVTYNNDLGQNLIQTFTISVTRFEPVSISVSGTQTYWDNGFDKFKLPSDLNFSVVYSDNTSQPISHNDLWYYRTEALVNALSVGSTDIKPSQGNYIYVTLAENKNVHGRYTIEFNEDEAVSLEIMPQTPIEFVLGNRLDSIRELLQIRAIFASGRIEESVAYSFVNGGEVLISGRDITINYGGRSEILDESNFNFIIPNIIDVIINHGTLPLTYNNKADSIDVRGKGITLNVIYENSTYTHVCNVFQSGEVILDNNEYRATSEVGAINGSEMLDADMEDQFEREFDINFHVRNAFNNTIEFIKPLPIKVVEIAKIIGMRLVKTYTNYYVNEEFLNDKDDTQLQIIFEDNNGVIRKTTINLNSNYSAINVFPLKGTKFLNPVYNRLIRISSATDSNVMCEYTINVLSKIVSTDYSSHDIVAVKTESFIAPNGETLENKYLLVDRFNTTIDVESGARISTVELTTDNVYGYLDDINSESTNARVILFNDYVPPVEGSNNITVEYPCYVEGNADKINKCKFGILFGNDNAKNRLFVSGNKDIPNCDWHSGQVDFQYLDDETMINGNFGYFEDTSYCFYGETDNAVVGYDIVSNDKLLVLKNKSDKETTIYFRTPTLMTAIDGAGTAMVGINGETLYQEEFTLIKGNNSVAAISPKSVVNFNGDSLFISSDNNLVGLDLVGIIGDNQRYANSRSYFIDEELRKSDLSKAWLWSNNKYLYLILPDKVFVTHFETKVDNQYEWWVVNVPDIQAILEHKGKRYLANSKGELHVITDKYDDVEKIFVGKGGSLLVTENDVTDTIITQQSVINQLDENKKYMLKVIPQENKDTSSMYYQIGSVNNTQTATPDFYVTDDNCLELVCLTHEDDVIVNDYERINEISNMISEKRPIYLNALDNENEVGAKVGSIFKTPYKPYYLKKYNTENPLKHDCYKLYDINGMEMPISEELYRATLCYKLDGEYEITNINKENSSFQILLNGKVVNLVRYLGQSINQAFAIEIRELKTVNAYYITKPFTMGSLDYFKTIWSWTLTNDTSIPSELEIGVASNKVPFESIKTLAKISVDQLGLDLNNMNFQKIDLTKNIVPRTYTNQRIISQVKFVCFAFKNFNNTNSVLSSMSIIYTTPHPSYSGD